MIIQNPTIKTQQVFYIKDQVDYTLSFDFKGIPELLTLLSVVRRYISKTKKVIFFPQIPLMLGVKVVLKVYT